MKIAVLMGSPRIGDSYNICKAIEAEFCALDEQVVFEYIFLKNYEVQDCRGCALCFQSGEEKCPCGGDDLSTIKNKLILADGVIIASPVYAYQITAQLKRVIDRLSYLFHRQEMVGKPTLIVITTDGGGSKQVYKYLKMTVSGWGLNLIGNLQICSPMYFDDRVKTHAYGYNAVYFEKKMRALRRVTSLFQKKLNQNEGKIPSFYEIFMFNCLRSKTYTSKLDYNFWLKKGWMNSDYFYEVKLNPLKKNFGHLMKSLIHRLGKSYLE
ncbi:flavodoxin family protein [Fusibacter ferrireducens]|uniref:Flavodoxin family protein n=1 Tax=Fusibacter ferrireducens TaxID=2785058 RepID=A0ABR9ZSZ9_9FIRM|nr:NAD(P)H-dependent oxidoreductase [Fusibacter ferrireducens]MBF4693596.1 flavodoxin family protein [Fusibacter ferrireducens]